jgi:hypothetical protein
MQSGPLHLNNNNIGKITQFSEILEHKIDHISNSKEHNFKKQFHHVIAVYTYLSKYVQYL